MLQFLENNMNTFSTERTSALASFSCKNNAFNFALVLHTVIAVCFFLIATANVIIDVCSISVIIIEMVIIISIITIAIIRNNRIMSQRETPQTDF